MEEQKKPPKPIPTTAQESIDSLLKEARKLRRSNTARAHALVLQALDCAESAENPLLIAQTSRALALIAGHQAKYEEARKLLNEALRTYEEHSAPAHIAQTMDEVGHIEYDRGHYHEAIRFARSSLALYMELADEVGQARQYSRLGIAMQKIGDLPRALEYLMQSYKLLQNLSDQNMLIACLNNLGLILKDMGRGDKALEYYLRGLSNCKAVANRTSESILHGNIGLVYEQEKRYDRALLHLRQSLAVARKANNQRQETIALANIASIQYDIGLDDAAIKTNTLGLKLARELGLYNCETHTLIGLARCLTRQSKFTESQECLQRARILLDKPGVKSLELDLLRAEMELLETRGDHVKALEYSRRFHEIEKAEIIRRSDQKLQDLQVLHETEQAHHAAEIQRLENVDLAAANQHLEELIRARNEFLGMAAHDLRNPISNIKGLAQFVKQQSDHIERSNIHDICADIESSSERILKLVTHLLDINRIDQGRLNVRADHFDLAQITKRYLSVSSEYAQSKDIRLEFAEPLSAVEAFADADIMVQVLDNLVSNAIKFSPAGTCVSVRVSTIKAASRQSARLEVSDEGPGLTPEDMQKLFGKFVRLSAQPTGGEESSGLGLSIVKQLIEAMHGSVWCESTFGQGATFIVELPIAPTA